MEVFPQPPPPSRYSGGATRSARRARTLPWAPARRCATGEVSGGGRRRELHRLVQSEKEPFDVSFQESRSPSIIWSHDREE